MQIKLLTHAQMRARVCGTVEERKITVDSARSERALQRIWCTVSRAVNALRAVYIGGTAGRLANRSRQHCLEVLSPEAQHFNRRKSLPRGHANGPDENRSTSEGSPTARRNELYLQLWHAPSSRNQPRFCFPIELHMRARAVLFAPAN